MKKHIIIASLFLIACKSTQTRINERTSKSGCNECPQQGKKYQGKYGGK